MCGVPVHSAELYLHRLIRKGFKVAICEQLEDPAEARKRPGKPLVRRDVVRIVTAGTLTEDGLLDPRRSNWLAALAASGAELGLARVDISTGAFATEPVARAELAAALARLAAGEILVPARLLAELDGPCREAGAAVTPLADASFDSIGAERRLCVRLRRRHARRARRFRPGRAGGGRRHPGLSRADAERGFCPASTGRGAIEPTSRDADRPGDAAQSRAACEPGSHPRGLPARGDRPHGDQCRRPPPGRTAGGAAGPAGADPGTARRGREPGRRRCSAAKRSAPRCAAARIWAAPWAGWRWRGAARAICSRWRRGWSRRASCGTGSRPSRPCARSRRGWSRTTASVPPPFGCARARGPAAGARRRLRPRRPDRRARRAAHAPRPEPPPHRCAGGALSRRDRDRLAQDPAQQSAGLLHRGACRPCGAGSARVRPAPGHGRGGPLQHGRARRAGEPDRDRGRAGAGARDRARSRSCAGRCWRAARPSPARLPPWPSSTCAPGSRRWPPSSAMSGPWSTTATPS